MSYVASGQRDWIRMLYGDETFLEMLETFGKLVEQRVLPAEKKTEDQRSRNPLKNFKSLLEEEAKFDRETFERTYARVREEEKIPAEVYARIVESGLTGMSFSEELGGLEIPFPVFTAFLEILGKASPSIGVRFAISNTVAEGLRFNFGAGDLSAYGQNVLRRLVSGEKLAAFCLTEASASGSNIMREMTTRAEPLPGGESYRITGNKMWITNAETADVYAVFARTSPDPSSGISLFLVERETPGFSVGQIFEKRSVENSSFGELVFKDAVVPSERLVGELGRGAQYAVRMLNSGRITIAALAVGLAQRALDEYMEVVVEGKKTAGKHLVEYDRTKARIADMSMEIHAARDMTFHAAWLKTRFDASPDDPELLRDYVIASNSAKLKASLVAQKASDHLVKVWGASAVVKENSSMKHYLDSWLYYFGEAVPEVLENTVAHMETKKYQARKGL
ncbi:MAG: acyl-CoA dehydrogenase family protein [Nitrospinae bacterium]|nr:acyl-CoA dehydrogenase family protein [Nitrospinota bacterium]